MGGLSKCWKALNHLLSSNECDLKHLSDLAGKPGIYSLYGGSVLSDDGTKMFLRLVNPQGHVEFDIKGERKITKSYPVLQAVIIPGCAEYNGPLKTGEEDIFIWQGDTSTLCPKLEPAIALVHELNRSYPPFHAMCQNENTLFHSLLKIMDLDMPKPVPGWAPGIEQLLCEDMRQVQDRLGICRETPTNETQWPSREALTKQLLDLA